MQSFLSLVEQQKETGGRIESIIRNYKKDPAPRKTKHYYEERIRRLDEEWSVFEVVDNQIRLLKDPPMAHEYFGNDYYSAISEIYNQYQEMFKAAIIETDLQLLTGEDQENTIKDPQPESSAVKKGTLIKTQPHEFIKLSRRQGAIITSLERLLENNINNQDLKAAQKLWDDVQDIHFQISELYEDPSAHGYNNTRYIAMEQTFRNACQTMMNASRTSASIESAPSQPHSETVPMPKITLPKFDGTLLKWQEFRDLFSSLVINQPINNVQKMWYLKTHLVGEAASLIKHFAAIGENFEHAWTMVNTRFNNKRLLISNLIQELIEPNNNGSKDNFKALHDRTQECLLALQNLEIDTSSWDPLLIHLLIKRLDQATRLRFEQSLSQPREVPTVKEFLAFLQRHFQSMEALYGNEKPSSVKTKVCTTVTQSSNLCAICKNGKHPLFACKAFL